MNLALFDFDGTITTKDSFIDFVKFIKGKKVTYAGLVLFVPLLALMKLKLLSNGKVKQKVFSYFFKGESLQDIQVKVKQYVEKSLPKMLKKSALDRIQYHKAQGDRIVLVSASLDLWLEEWTKSEGIELICTKIEVDSEGRVTGRFSSPNCYGQEKVNRIKMLLDVHKYEKIYAYGDSRGDREMLQLAVKPYFKRFNK